MQVLIYDKLTDGLPGTTVIDDLTYRNPTVQFTHRAMWGPYTASFSWPGGVEEGLRWAGERLGNPVEIYSPDGDHVWEGLIWSVSFGVGNRRRTRSLEAYANRVVIQYTAADFATDPPTIYGPVTSPFSDSAHQAVYSVIDHWINGGQLAAAEANARAAAELEKRTRLQWIPEGSGGDGITVECMGWWRTLGYRSRKVTSTALTTDVRDAIRLELSAAAYGSDLAPFISKDVDLLEATGVTTPLAHELMTLTEVVNHYVALLPSWVFGIGPGRVPYLRASQRLSTTPTCLETAYGIITDTAGAEVPPYLVRPDNVLRQVDFVPVGASLSTAAIDAVENVYVVETVYDSESNSATYQPATVGVDGELAP